MCVKRTSVPTSGGTLVRGRGVESIYWCGYLVLWQAESLNQPPTAGFRQALHAHPRTWGEEASAEPDLINKCSSPVPQLSEMMMILFGSEQSDGDSTGRNTERQKETERDLKVEPPVRCHFLKAKCLSAAKQGDNMLMYSNKMPRASPTLPLADQRAKHLICWGKSCINYQKLELKIKTCLSSGVTYQLKTQS